jgi:hypothetical protein
MVAVDDDFEILNYYHFMPSSGPGHIGRILVPDTNSTSISRPTYICPCVGNSGLGISRVKLDKVTLLYGHRVGNGPQRIRSFGLLHEFATVQIEN